MAADVYISLVVATPFPLSLLLWLHIHCPGLHVTCPSAAAARALGQIFDSTVLSRHAVRPMADAWVGWSVKWTRRFGDEWARQLPLALARLLQVLRLQMPRTQNR
jgi:hypothetical protein